MSGSLVADMVGERMLVPKWAPELIALSFCTSWLGSYTSTQLHIHAQYTTRRLSAWLCVGVGSLAFGFCAIWSMHFLGMLACGLDVQISFDIPLTILSAVVAVGFTFVATFTSDISFFLPQPSQRNPREDLEAASSPRTSMSAEIPSSHGREQERAKLLSRDVPDGEDAWDVPEGLSDATASLPGDRLSSIWTSWYKRGRRHLLKLVVRAAIWAMAIVFMHYCGMRAMIIPEGRIEWNFGMVALSCLVAFVVTFVACILMFHMHFHLGRQLASSTIAALGVCSMHYTGMAGATFYTNAPPSPTAGYPPYLPYAIITIAVFVCVVSNAILANSAILARNRLSEAVAAKRRLWRLTAEKNAAQRSEALKQQFIAVASHEIRTPLHTVIGYTELLLRTELSPEQAQYVKAVEQACHAINVIAGNVLDFSKLERNNVESPARPVRVTPKALVETLSRMAGALGEMEEDAEQPPVETMFSVARDVPERVLMDETYTLRVLMNLLSNAQKFTTSGFISVALSCPSATSLVVRVSDSGCGIPDSSHSAIFEPFRRVNSVSSTPGAGLGLAIVRQLVERMGGTISVASSLNAGSTFIVAIPLAPRTDDGSPPRESKPSKRRRVKVFAQSPGTANAVADLWRAHGAEAISVADDCTLKSLGEADVIWADLHTIRTAPALQDLLREPNHHPPVRICVVATDHDELAAALARIQAPPPDGRRVRVVQRPVLIHRIVDALDAEDAGVISVPSEKPHLSTNALEGQSTENNRANTGDSVATLVQVDDEVGVEGKKVVLLAEDNLINQRLGKRLVEKLGYDVVTASDGQQAVEVVQRVQCHACLMDCQMPVLDGFGATRRIRRLEAEGVLPRRLRVIALTANVTTESEDACRAAGMDAFLPKPLKITDLESLLREP